MKTKLPAIGRPNKSGLSVKFLGKVEYMRLRYERIVRPLRIKKMKENPFHHFLIRFNQRETRTN